MSGRSAWMLLGAALLVIIPLLMGGEFAGTDSKVAELIEGTEGFSTWFDPIWTPPSAEIESLFFALQAALGALVIGYVIGRLHGRRHADAPKDDVTQPRT